jgi:site-specific DNA-methyltransferase (adenine-specific)
MPRNKTIQIDPIFTTALGKLYHGDCMEIFRYIDSSSVNTIFADPPFNLGKDYGTSSNDDLPEAKYLAWCCRWLKECIRVLQPGGSLFVYNLPKWNMPIGTQLTDAGMDFRHWIAVEHKSGHPISGRLYPAHYSLLYFTKGKPVRFQRIRTPIEKCRHCDGEIRDYGGHRNAMNIPPVRHRKFKPEKRVANALSTKLLERVIEISTLPGDLVLDPFGGSGTTFAVCEQRNRHWIGIEIGDPGAIIDRLSASPTANHRNTDFVEHSASPQMRIAAE